MFCCETPKTRTILPFFCNVFVLHVPCGDGTSPSSLNNGTSVMTIVMVIRQWSIFFVSLINFDSNTNDMYDLDIQCYDETVTLVWQVKNHASPECTNNTTDNSMTIF